MEPVVSFGGVLSKHSLIHGGAVKLLSLQRAFSTDERDFNILYLVSSSLPDFPEDLVDLCRNRKIPLVWNQNGVGYPAWAGKEAERFNGPMRRLRAASDFVVYQSEFCRISADRWLGEVSTPSRVLLNPVDLNTFFPAREPLPDRPLKVLAMGTQNYPERVFHAIQALANLRKNGVEARLTIAGRLLWKDAGPELENHLRRHGLQDHVTLRPAFRQEEAPAICRAHHVLIHPKFMDPCPTVVAEALACGLPVVASATGGLPEMVDQSSGCLIPGQTNWDTLETPAGNELARATESLLENLPAHARAARLRAESLFDSSRWVAAHAEIFSRLL